MLPEAMLSRWTNCKLETKSSGFLYNHWTDNKNSIFMILGINPVHKWNGTAPSVNRIPFEFWGNKLVLNHAIYTQKLYSNISRLILMGQILWFVLWPMHVSIAPGPHHIIAKIKYNKIKWGETLNCNISVPMCAFISLNIVPTLQYLIVHSLKKCFCTLNGDGKKIF